MIESLVIQAFAYATFLYRFRGQGLSPDGRLYAAMAEGHHVPQPYSRRWLLPFVLKSKRAWSIASGLAFVAVGPLIYALTDSLACVWLCAWLPGLAINIRFPVLVDQVAFTLMLGAVVAYQQGAWWVALPMMFIAGQCKEVAPIFGGVLCMDPIMGVVAGASLACALVVGRLRSVPGEEEYMLHPFRVAMGKHDPLSWAAMLLPWGGAVVLAVMMQLELVRATVVAGVSLALGYGQLLLANDEARLFVWAAPAVLAVVAGYSGPWMVPALVAHPFLCGASKRV